MNTNCVFTVLHIHACVPPPPTHLHKVASCLVTCSIFFPMAAKALQTLSLLPVTVTSLRDEQRIMNHHTKQTSDMHHRTQITMETDTHHMDHCWTHHHGNRQTLRIITDHHGNRHYGSQITMEQTHTIWVITDHHGNRHTSYGSSWNTYNHKNRRPPRTHYHETNMMDDHGTNRYINMEHCRSSPPRAYRATKGRWPYPPISCGSISTWHVCNMEYSWWNQDMHTPRSCGWELTKGPQSHLVWFRQATLSAMLCSVEDGNASDECHGNMHDTAVELLPVQL